MTRSLTLRVTIAFAAIVMLAAAGLGAYLYQAFVAEIERRDDIQLLGKLRQVQILLGRPGAAQLVREQPEFFRDTMSGQENSLVRIVAADGAVLADINATGERYPMAAASALPRVDAIRSWRGRSGAPGRVAAATARLDGNPVTIVVARLYSERDAAFARYRHRIAGGVAASALLAAVLAALMLRAGLRPLRAVAAHAGRMRPGNLSARLDAGHAPSELLPLIAAFNAMLDRLQEGYARLAGFSADLAHEFRTPITNMIGQSQVMLGKARTVADFEQLTASNVEELERLARMIESMLFLARADQREVVLARQRVAAHEELARVADFYEGMAEERGLVFLCRGEALLAADSALLRRALANLVSNAVRHAEPGSCIELDAVDEGGRVTLSVANRGADIGREHLPHLFERFYRADAARREGEGSTGLGLSIVGAIMHLHGGAVHVESSGGRTVFMLSFPPW